MYALLQFLRRRVPAGTSDYQAAWILDEDNHDADVDDDEDADVDGTMDADVASPHHVNQQSTVSTADLDNCADADGGLVMNDDDGDETGTVMMDTEHDEDDDEDDDDDESKMKQLYQKLKAQRQVGGVPCKSRVVRGQYTYIGLKPARQQCIYCNRSTQCLLAFEVVNDLGVFVIRNDVVNVATTITL